MKFSKLIVASTLVASSTFLATAIAGEKDKFTQLDVDGDGMISSQEAAADPELSRNWALADANRDGQLERAEFSALEIKPEAGKDR